MFKKALFLDRDGTINVEKNYVYRIEDFEFREGIFELVKAYFNDGYSIFVVSNQSGIARGFYTENDVKLLNSWLLEQFEYRGIKISAIYYCPHHPDFTGDCECRKPKPGMIMQAIGEWGLDPAQCVLIGDKEIDVLAGKNANIGKNIKINRKGKINSQYVSIHKG